MQRYAAPVAGAVAASSVRRSRATAAGASRRACAHSSSNSTCPSTSPRESRRWRRCIARWTWWKSPWQRRVEIGYAARAYFDIGERIGLTWIKEQIESLAVEGHWQAAARRTVAGQPVRPATQDHRRGARLQGPGRGRAGRPMDPAPRGAGRHPEADRGRSAHRFAARFRHPVGRLAGGKAACAALKISKTLFRENDADDAFGVGYLQDRIDRRIPAGAAPRRRRSIPPHDGAAVLRAPFAPNANYKGTAFGGSLFCVAVLTGWAWATRYHRGTRAERRRRDPGIDDPLLETGPRRVSRNPARHRRRSTWRNSSRCWRVPDADAFGLHVEIHDGHTLSARFDGVFVAALRPRLRFLGRTSCPEN